MFGRAGRTGVPLKADTGRCFMLLVTRKTSRPPYTVWLSLSGSVRIAGADRIGLEPLLRYCARPPFALTHLHQRDAGHPVTRNPQPARTTAPGTQPMALVLRPLESITKIAALVPPPRAHRHRYTGVQAPNAPRRSVVTALAPAALLCTTFGALPAPTSAATREEPRQRAVAGYLWAMLLSAHLRGLPAAMPDLPRIHLHHRLHQRCRQREQDPRPYRRIHPASMHRPSAWATAVEDDYGGGTGA